MSIYGNATGGFGFPKTFVFQDKDGNEIALGVVTDQEQIFDATDNDVREGIVYASENGVSTGTKIIPVYYAGYGEKIVLANEEAIITTPEYNYDNLMVIISTYSTSLSQSFVSTYVSIYNAMYPIGSDTKISDIIIDKENGKINLGITVDEKSVLRYFIIREEY